MDKRELELIYMDYLNSLKPVRKDLAQKEVHKYKIDQLKEKIMEKFKQPLYVLPESEKEKANKIEEGQIRLLFKDQVPILYLVYDLFDQNLYQVLKMSTYWELGNENDLITKVNNEVFIVEVWNSFYLTEDEIKNSIFYGILPKEDWEILKNYKEGKIKELPRNRRGLKVPFNEDYIQIKFHKKESELVRNYELRPLLMDDEDYE